MFVSVPSSRSIALNQIHALVSTCSLAMVLVSTHAVTGVYVYVCVCMCCKSTARRVVQSNQQCVTTNLSEDEVHVDPSSEEDSWR
jgi:hypothetical protein